MGRAKLTGAIALAVICLALGVSASWAASEQSVREHVDLKLVKKSGGSKFEHSGRANGTFRGTVRSKIALSHSVVLRGTLSS
jgi:hypothetical protein